MMMPSSLSYLSVLLVISVVLMSVNAIASELPSLSVDLHKSNSNSINRDLSDNEVSNRIRFLQARFERGTLHAQLWQYGWLAGFSTAVASRTYAVASEEDAPQRFDAAVGIFTSLSGVLSVALKPLPASFSAKKLRAMPGATADQRRIKLQYGEQLLMASAQEAKRRRGWTIQGVFLLEQLLAGLAIGIIDDRPKDGLLTAVSGMIASELFTFTMPTKSIVDLNVYANTAFSDKVISKQVAPSARRQFFLTPHARGIRVAYFF